MVDPHVAFRASRSKGGGSAAQVFRSNQDRDGKDSILTVALDGPVTIAMSLRVPAQPDPFPCIANPCIANMCPVTRAVTLVG
jgi:hypothetical protein